MDGLDYFSISSSFILSHIHPSTCSLLYLSGYSMEAHGIFMALPATAHLHTHTAHCTICNRTQNRRSRIKDKKQTEQTLDMETGLDIDIYTTENKIDPWTWNGLQEAL